MKFQVKDVIVHDIWYDHLRAKKQKKLNQTILLFNELSQNDVFFQNKKIIFKKDFLTIEYQNEHIHVPFFEKNNVFFCFIDIFDITRESDLFENLKFNNLFIKKVFHKTHENAKCFDKDIEISISDDVIKIHRKSGSLTGITGLKLLTRQKIYHSDSSESFGGYITYITHESDQLWLLPLLKNNIPIRVIATEKFEWLNNTNVDIIYAQYENSEWTLTDIYQQSWKASSLLFSNNNHEGFEINLQLDLEHLTDDYIENMWFSPIENDYANQFGIGFSYNNDIDNVHYQKILKINSHVDLCRQCEFKQACINIEGPRYNVTNPLNNHKCSILINLKK